MPFKTHFIVFFFGKIGAQKVDDVRLFAQSDGVQFITRLLGQILNKRGFSDPRIPLLQDGFVELHAPQDLLYIDLREIALVAETVLLISSVTLICLDFYEKGVESELVFIITVVENR